MIKEKRLVGETSRRHWQFYIFLRLERLYSGDRACKKLFVPVVKLVSDEDELFLEDKSQRIKLVGLGKKSNYIFTGECGAVHGKLLDDGSFEVTDIIYPSVEPVLTKTKPGSFKAVSSAIISDMGFGSPDEPSQIKQELLSNFLTDMVGEENEQSCGLHQAIFCGVLCKGKC